MHPINRVVVQLLEQLIDVEGIEMKGSQKRLTAGVNLSGCAEREHADEASRLDVVFRVPRLVEGVLIEPVHDEASGTELLNEGGVAQLFANNDPLGTRSP